MGCHNSKQARRDILLSPSPLRRSTSSLPDERHFVSLTSSTFGSLALDVAKEQCILGKEPDADDVLAGLADARAWSVTIGRKIPRTPTETPPGEPEPVNAWELMAGLHGDFSPLHRRSFSFYPVGNNADRIGDKKGNADGGKAKAVIFYFTSLRGVRKTYDDCCSVRAMLKEHGVRVDERDVSMHAGFREELRELSDEVSLPRVLVGGRDLGGAEEVRRMHERGELGKVLEGWKGGNEEECKGCGDIRFVPCDHCSGSCRVYVDELEEEEGGGWRRCSECNENGIVRCPVCC